jgi:outer membrane receptor for ferrienterochelin and colicins
MINGKNPHRFPPGSTERTAARVAQGPPLGGLRWLLLSFFFSLLPVAAQQIAPSAGDLMDLSFDELLEVRVDKVYGASKFLQPVTQAPASITIIDADQIKRYGYRSLGEVLRSVRGFYLNNDRTYTSLGTRGFQRPGDYNNRILLLLNGHRMNDNVYDSAPVGNEFFVDIDLIERVEVIRGSSSALYGNSAFFGVINIVTKNPNQFGNGEVSTEAGTYDAYKARFSLGQQISKDTSFLVSGSYFDRAGQPQIHFPPFDAPETNNGIARHRDWDRFTSIFTQLNHKKVSVDAGFHVRETGIPTAPYGVVFNHPGNRAEDLMAFINANHTHEFDPAFDITSRINYGHYDFKGDYVYEGELPTDPEFIPNYDRSSGRWLISESTVRKRLFDRHQLLAGMEYRIDLRREQRNLDLNPAYSYLYSNKPGNIWSPYASLDFGLRTNLNLSLGVRHDHYNNFGGATHPRAGLVYQPRSKTGLKYIYSEAFRAPTAFELYYHDDHETAKANPGLEPEEIISHEVIWEEQLNSYLNSSVSLFHYNVDELIAQELDPVDDLIVHRNLNSVRNRGAEFELQLRNYRGIQTRLSYTYQDINGQLSGGEVMDTPSHLAKFNLIVPLYEDKVSLGWESLFTSSRDTRGGFGTGDQWLNNLTLFARNLRPGLEISASLYNIFDETFYHPAGPEIEPNWVIQEGRNFRVKLTYRF